MTINDMNKLDEIIERALKESPYWDEGEARALCRRAVRESLELILPCTKPSNVMGCQTLLKQGCGNLICENCRRRIPLAATLDKGEKP